MTDEKKYVVETWTYMGARRGSKVSKVYVWRDERGEEMVYYKLRASVIGGKYEIEVSRSGDKTTVSPDSVKYAGVNEEMSAEVAGWRVQNALTDESLSRERLERKDKSANGPFGDALEPLLKLYGTLRTRHDRIAFQAMVLTALNGW
jgi:hypothetical protein